MLCFPLGILDLYVCTSISYLGLACNGWLSFIWLASFAPSTKSVSLNERRGEVQVLPEFAGAAADD